MGLTAARANGLAACAKGGAAATLIAMVDSPLLLKSLLCVLVLAVAGVGCGDDPTTGRRFAVVDAGTGVLLPGGGGDSPSARDASYPAEPDAASSFDAGQREGCIQDDHGDVRRGASWVGDPSRTEGAMNCPTDLDLFRFTANRAGEYRIYTEGIEVACSLERQAGQAVADSDGEACDLTVELALGNVYYVTLEPEADGQSVGDYILVVGAVDDEPPPPQASCGDGRIDAGEDCDDGNNDDRDACLSTCRRARCGDGVVWLGVEPCDDGNLDNGDACLTTCRVARCGDGMVRRGVEACDDGNVQNGDGCSSQCQDEGQNPNRAPSTPRIAVIGQAVRSVAFSGIEVTLGRDPEAQLVQAICWSSGSNHSTEARAVASRFARGGQVVEVTLTWTTTGQKTVYCKTRDESRALSGSARATVTVEAPNRSPGSPRITVEGTATSGEPFEFSVRLGTDPDRDQVQALCWSSGSDHSVAANGAVSALVNSGSTASVSLTWRSAGSRTIYCRTRDEHGEESGVWDTERVQVENPNRAPSRSTISTDGNATTRQPFEVRVLLGRDPDRDDVRAKCWSTGSDYASEARAARSELTSGGRTAVLQFTWRSSGTKSLYCETEDEHGMVSSSRDRESVRVAN